MTYRAEAVTQQDGSSLAASNCRMASISTGIDYETMGDTTSTGAKMRARQPDQSGGTDSGDAKIAWASYDKNLIVKDGSTFDDALADLRAMRLVHLDVWHKTCGGPCLSGTGGYGHTMAVAPESRVYNGRKQWLVADPWCKPAKWVWWDESKLRAGAEDWGARVSTRGIESGGPDPARELLSEHTPDNPADDDTDTGGYAEGGPILYTTTHAVEDETGMKLTEPKAAVGTVVFNENWPMYRVRDDVKTPDIPKGTKYTTTTEITYHQSPERPQGYRGYLVPRGDDKELYVAPGGKVTFAPTPTSPTASYPVTVGGKTPGPDGKVQLP